MTEVHVVMLNKGGQSLAFAVMTDAKAAADLCLEYVRALRPGAAITIREGHTFFTDANEPGDDADAWVQSLTLDDTKHAIDEINVTKRVATWKGSE